jgi:hypothetical protein
MTDLEREFRECELRQRWLDAEANARPDETVLARRTLKWLAAKLDVPLPADLQIKRYRSDARPGVNGFVWRGDHTIYLAHDAGRRTVIHEGVHVLRPDFSETQVRALAAKYAAELAQPVDTTLPIPESEQLVTVERDHGTLWG